MKKVFGSCAARAAIAIALSSAAAASLEAAPKAQIAKGSVLALYSDIGVCARNPAVKAYFSEFTAALAGTEFFKPCADWLVENGYLDYESYGEGWTLFTVGQLTRPDDDATTFSLPDITVSAFAEKRNPLDVAPIVKLWNEYAPQDAKDELAANVKIVRKSIAGAQVRELEFAEDPTEGFIPNFKVCWTRLDGDRLFIAALSEEALARQIILQRDGVGETDPAFEGLLSPTPETLGRLLVPSLGRTISSLVRDDELALLGTLPDETPIADVLKNLGDLSYEVFLEEFNERIVLSLDFGKPETAQMINGMLMMVLVPAKAALNEADDGSDPEVARVAKVFRSIKTVVDGTVVKFSMEIPWKDFVANLASKLPDIEDALAELFDLYEEECGEQMCEDPAPVPETEIQGEDVPPAVEPVAEPQPEVVPPAPEPVAEPQVEQAA